MISPINTVGIYTHPGSLITTSSLNDRIETEREASKEREAMRIEKERKWKEKWERDQKERFEKIKKEQAEATAKKEAVKKKKLEFEERKKK